MVNRYTLKNQVPLFVVESHASPVVSIQAWVSRGSIHETDRLAGISHFLEHALFKGTKRRDVGEVAKEIESLGGEVNAFTSFEETAFYCTLASRYFEEGLDVIADMMQNPSFDKEEMEREKEVILEEIKRAHDSPYKTVSMNLWSSTFPGTPYGRPVLGYKETVAKINAASLRTYFEQNYHAGTMSLFIVGDVDADKVFEECQDQFGRLKQGPRKATFAGIVTPKLRQPKIVSVARDIKECHVQIGIAAPRINDPVIPAMDLLCSALGQGESSRLHQRLVKETRLAQDVHLGLMSTGQCGLAALTLVVNPENLEAAINESFSVLATAAKQGLDPTELERVQTSLEAEVVAGKETVDGYARRLGYYYIEFHDPEYEGKYLQKLLAVDTERTGEALFNLFEKKPVLSMVHPETMKLDKGKLVSAVSRPMLRPIAGKSPKNLPEKTNRGSVRYITKTVKTLPMVSLRLLFPGGSREETPEMRGVGNLFGRLWTSGTDNYDALKIAQTLEALGASISGFAGKNTVGIAVECLAKHWRVVKPLLSDILLHPKFPAHEFETERELVLREIHSEKDTPGQLCQHNFLQALYGDHPYGRSALGTKESVQKLSSESVKKFYKDFVHKNELVATVAGSFQKELWINELAEIVEQLPPTGKSKSDAFTMAPIDSVKIVSEKKAPLFQAHLLVGFRGATFQDPERYALKLLSSSLAGQGGRLFLELRDKQSLAYQVAPLQSDSPEPGIFGFYIGCGPEKLERALAGIRLEIQKVLDTPISKRELERAKEYWIGRFELDMQRLSAQAMLYGLDEVYGLGYNHSQTVPDTIKALSSKDIQDAARTFLTPDRAVISVVHNEELSRERLEKLWMKP